MKWCSTSVIIKKCKSKLQYLTPVRMAIVKMSTYNKATGEGVEKREPSYTVGGKVNWHSHYGEQYGDYVQKNPESRATIWSNNPTGLISEKDENSNLERYIHPSVYSRFICNIQDMEATLSVHSSVCVCTYICTHIHTYIYIYICTYTHICICNEISLSHKKERK